MTDTKLCGRLSLNRTTCTLPAGHQGACRYYHVIEDDVQRPEAEAE